MRSKQSSGDGEAHTKLGRRLDSVDIMRTVAIVLMVHDHFVHTLSRDPLNSFPSSVSNMIICIVGCAAAPIFTFLVGVSLQLTVNKQKYAGVDRPTTSARIWWRGLFFLCFNFLFTVVVWSPQFLFDCDILAFIGLALLILYSMRSLSAVTMILIISAILLASPPLRSVSDYANHWDVYKEYTHNFTIKDVMLGVLLNGHFPLLPWLVFPLSGFVMANLFLSRNARQAARGMTLPMVGASLFILPAINCPQQERELECYYKAWTLFYPATTTFVVSVLGIVILLFWALHRWVDVKPRESHFIVFCRRYSRFSLTTFFAHYIVLHFPLFLAAKLNSKSDPWYYFRNVCSTPLAVVLSLLFDVVFYAVIVMWERRHRSRYNLEWLEWELFAMIFTKFVHPIK